MRRNNHIKLILKKNFSIISGFFLILVFISCGDSDKSEASEESNIKDNSSLNVNACTFLTKADVEEVLGEEVNEGEEDLHTDGTENTAALSQCSYSSKSSNKNVSLMIRKSPVPDKTAGQSVKETLKESGIPVQDITDLEVTAFWSDPQLHIYHDEYLYLLVSVRGSGPEESLEKAKATAKKIIKRI